MSPHDNTFWWMDEGKEKAGRRGPHYRTALLPPFSVPTLTPRILALL